MAGKLHACDSPQLYPQPVDDSGALTLMRAPDGVHLSPQGGTRLAEAVLRLIRDHSADPALALPRTGRAR